MDMNTAEVDGLSAGMFWMPGIGKLIVTITGVVIEAEAVVNSGS